jgi:hypothetical protein
VTFCNGISYRNKTQGRVMRGLDKVDFDKELRKAREMTKGYETSL